MNVSKEMAVIKQAMIDDNPSEVGSYAHSWHCNIAMACFDAIIEDDKDKPEILQVSHNVAHRIANDAASRCMRLIFGVETNSGQ